MTETFAATFDADRAYDLDRRHVFHSWSAQAKLDPMVVTKAEGSYVWDRDGNRLTFAKGVNSGYVPLGGVVVNDAISSTFAERPYPGGLTYSGHPLACAAAVATIETMANEGIVDHVAALGDDVFGPGLRELAAKHDWIGEVRGTGAFWAIELVADRATREPLAPYGGTSPAMVEIVAACQRRGLLPLATFNRIHAVPPLTTTAEEAREGLDILDQALTEARATLG
ncbi:MAG: aminotransferase class III-fold pyridoxal phosphate-dependent enzyme [Actinophytocola sp.]|nr:aminotransferase class III-fold pyridoxal phosphate-dependent enzyme [Actinophytocola sp.]